MKILKDTLQTSIETWEDPGDYPSAAGSYPLPSYDYIEEVCGEVQVELNDEELQVLKTAIDEGWVSEWSEELELDMPDGVSSIKWGVKLNGRIVTLTVNEFEADRDWEPEEGDYD